MKKPVVVFRVSNWFLDRINEYCRSQGLTYAELINRAIAHLCQKYQEECNEKRASSRSENRVEC